LESAKSRAKQAYNAIVDAFENDKHKAQEAFEYAKQRSQQAYEVTKATVDATKHTTQDSYDATKQSEKMVLMLPRRKDKSLEYWEAQGASSLRDCQ
jgi:hypothetical protein